MSKFRIEAEQPAVQHSVRQHGRHLVNNKVFQLVDGLVLSEPLSEREVAWFDVEGYHVRQAEAPYAYVRALGESKITITANPEPAAPPIEQPPTLEPQDSQPQGNEAGASGDGGEVKTPETITYTKEWLESLDKPVLVALARKHGLGATQIWSVAKLVEGILAKAPQA